MYVIDFTELALFRLPIAEVRAWNVVDCFSLTLARKSQLLSSETSYSDQPTQEYFCGLEGCNK